jgi:hypothetical protein
MSFCARRNTRAARVRHAQGSVEKEGERNQRCGPEKQSRKSKNPAGQTMRDSQNSRRQTTPTIYRSRYRRRARLWLRAINRGATGERVSTLCNRLMQF